MYIIPSNRALVLVRLRMALTKWSYYSWLNEEVGRQDSQYQSQDSP